jgi:hypothetical protein
MPQYRFVLREADQGAERAEEFGIFNDEGAMQFARRYGASNPVEVWHQERLVGRVEPSRMPVTAE